MFKTDDYWITIAEVKGFSTAAAAVFSADEREALTDFLAMSPASGELVEGSGGLRVVSWPAKSQGPAGEVEVLYLFRDLNMPVHLLGIYESDDPFDPSEEELVLMASRVEELVDAYAAQKLAVFKSPSGAA